MDKLFKFRKLFRDVAIKSNPRNLGSLVVTWVDNLLANLAVLIVNIASAPAPANLPQASASEAIQLQTRHDMIRASAQLPGNDLISPVRSFANKILDKWDDLRIVLGSDDFSPAARRLALSLMFAAYVMEAQLAGVQSRSWAECRYASPILVPPSS